MSAQSELDVVVACRGCLQGESMCRKYVKLIDLMRIKIKKMEKKWSSSQISQSQRQTLSSINVSNQRQEAQSLKLTVFKVDDIVIRPIKAKQQSNSQRSLNLSIKIDPLRFSKTQQFSTFKSGQIDDSLKAKKMINKLTEEIIQVKSNFMHVRHCLYALLKEIQIEKKVGNHVILNIFLALSNIFQFSQEERQEMLHLKKMKLRKRQKVGKQNIFKTVTQS